jgi:hypothetical protein
VTLSATILLTPSMPKNFSTTLSTGSRALRLRQRCDEGRLDDGSVGEAFDADDGAFMITGS